MNHSGALVFSLFMSKYYLIPLQRPFCSKVMCVLFDSKTFGEYFSCLFLIDFWLDSTGAGDYALCDFSPLKSVETCFMAQKTDSFSECSTCIEKNVYSPVLLIMLLK